ncbi:hypothetical protein IV203_020183 [Nitzschia inconspicua]|uniref:Uncharacterized protein n=1 Tax=Nitzschia inconspicua TaxID=303405 RepID=A0A9K3M0W3_9STRA|nr:hypothetical protein IV203_020373 [Nitzschia inconspicua]KAG7371613.1 hypothetical protein IV203_020183 [Nitzschia inconspicua]
MDARNIDVDTFGFTTSFDASIQKILSPRQFLAKVTAYRSIFHLAIFRSVNACFKVSKPRFDCSKKGGILINASYAEYQHPADDGDGSFGTIAALTISSSNNKF